ncbi:MAG: hypothetical protein R2684_14575 [Pyrinomonadaceae bacterium]
MTKTIGVVLHLTFLAALAVLPLQLLAQSSVPPFRDFSKGEYPAIADNDYHRTVNERFVRETFKKIYEAEAAFAGFWGYGEFGTLQQLGEAGLIDSVLANGEKYGYVFSISVVPLNAFGNNFTVKATPTYYQRTGKLSFVMDAACRIHGGDKAGFDAEFKDPVLDSCLPFLAIQFEYDSSLIMRQIIGAQATYYESFGNGRYGTLGDLILAGLIDGNLASAWNSRINMSVFPPTETGPARYVLGMRPWYRHNGMRSYYVNETGILRAEDLGGASADENSPELIFENEDLIKFAMRSLWKAQITYAGYSHLGNGNFTADFEVLTKLRLLDFAIENGSFGGYSFEIVVDNNHKNSIFRDFEMRATPLQYGKNSSRSFYISRHAFLRGADRNGEHADRFDPLVEF